MLNCSNVYQTLAEKACREVFVQEYLGSIGIPLPKISFLAQDSPQYQSGEFYIYVGDSWQINLKFGALPESYEQFEKEVKVLTRHEIEHYMCCPYDMVTQKRMELAILRTIKKDEFRQLDIDTSSLKRVLANHASDIIIDTKLFFEHREVTRDSEKDWIKKTTANKFSDLPRHARLFFLVKEKLWGENLGLEEQDEELKREVARLASVFEKGGITNKSLFIGKTVEYTHTYLTLYQNEKASAQCPLPVPQDSSRDSHADGGQFVVSSSEALREAMVQLAQEANIDEFIELFDEKEVGLKDKEKLKIWFEAKSAEEIPIIEQVAKGSQDNYSYPVTWRLGDRMEDLDMMLTYAVSPVLIPGITTKKWVQNQSFHRGADNVQPDLLLVLDSSGSMGSLKVERTKLHEAVLACFGIAQYFEKLGSSIALLNFSDVINKVEWTRDFEAAKDHLLYEGGGATKFPTEELQRLLAASKTKVVMVIITDGEIQNTEATLKCLEKSLLEGNKLYMFVQDTKGISKQFEGLEDLGATVHKVINVDDIRNSVLNGLG